MYFDWSLIYDTNHSWYPSILFRFSSLPGPCAEGRGRERCHRTSIPPTGRDICVETGFVSFIVHGCLSSISIWCLSWYILLQQLSQQN